MNNRSAFDLDCNPVIPECGTTDRCFQRPAIILRRILHSNLDYKRRAAELMAVSQYNEKIIYTVR